MDAPECVNGCGYATAIRDGEGVCYGCAADVDRQALADRLADRANLTGDVDLLTLAADVEAGR
jgi:hypothetical protein